MTTTLATSEACLIKAGDGVALVWKEAEADTYWNSVINQVESTICNITRYNWIDNYSSLNSDAKLLIEETVSNLAAIYAIQYDMSGYTSRNEAESMINLLGRNVDRNIELLKDKKVQDFINGA